MESYDTVEIALARWEQSFRANAQADDCQVLRAHLRSLNLRGDPHLLLEGTILFVQMSVAYLTLDQQKVEEFLAQQKYDPTPVVDAPYLVTFDICRKAYARISLPASLRPVDLADLYGSPWNDYGVVGYCDIWIARADGMALSAEEMAGFEKVVDSDLRFDYDEDELAFWFDPDTHAGILKVTVQDVDDDEFEDDEDCDDDDEKGSKPHD